MTRDDPISGWDLVASGDEAATLLGALVDLDADETFTKSALADATGVPMKTLYLLDILDDLEAVGVIDRVDDGDPDSEAAFSLNRDSPVLEAARAFDEAVAEQYDGDEP